MGKKGAAVDESSLPAEERERRRVQRERRALAIRQREAGYKYTPLKLAKLQPWRKREEGGVGYTGEVGARGRVEKKERDAVKRKERREEARRRRCPFDCVVIPIAWRRQAAQAGDVSAASAEVHAAAEAAGLKACLDESTELAPGQKYRKYEEMGVMVRLEVGPSEAQKGGLACVLARTTKPGEMADKSKVDPGGDAEVLVRAIRRAMEDGGGGGGEVLDEVGAEEAEAEEADDGQGAAAAVAHDGEMIDYNAL